MKAALGRSLDTRAPEQTTFGDGVHTSRITVFRIVERQWSLREDLQLSSWRFVQGDCKHPRSKLVVSDGLTLGEASIFGASEPPELSVAGIFLSLRREEWCCVVACAATSHAFQV